MDDKFVRVAVVDGQGGGIGRAITERIKTGFPDINVRALGTNSMATAAMLKGGADDGATGENAIICNVSKASIILGPIGIIVANGLLGEITPAIAVAIGESDAPKILVPSSKCNVRIAAGSSQTTQAYLNESMVLFSEILEKIKKEIT